MTWRSEGFQVGFRRPDCFRRQDHCSPTKQYGIDPKTKLLVPSDGEDLPLILKLEDHFRGRIKVSHGWGQNLTNDLFDNALAW